MTFDVSVQLISVPCRVALRGRRLEGAPGVEAAGEAVRLIPLPDQTQLPGVLRVLGAHVLNVNLQAEKEGVRKWAESSLSPIYHVYV